MNYDLAYELQKAMRDSEEHKEMMAAQEAIKDLCLCKCNWNMQRLQMLPKRKSY